MSAPAKKYPAQGKSAKGEVASETSASRTSAGASAATTAAWTAALARGMPTAAPASAQRRAASAGTSANNTVPARTLQAMQYSASNARRCSQGAFFSASTPSTSQPGQRKTKPHPSSSATRDNLLRTSGQPVRPLRDAHSATAQPLTARNIGAVSPRNSQYSGIQLSARDASEG